MGNNNSNIAPQKYSVIAKSSQTVKRKSQSLSMSVLSSPIKEQLAQLSVDLENDARVSQNQNNSRGFRTYFSNDYIQSSMSRSTPIGRHPSFVSSLSINVNAPLRQVPSPMPMEPMTPPTPAIAVVENPCPRYVHSTCSYKNNLYMFGGYNGESYLNDLYRYDLIKKEWKLISGCSSSNHHPSRRSDHNLIYRNTTHEIVLFGGWADPARLSDTWVCNLKNAQWKRLHVSNEAKMFPNGMTLACQLYHQKSDSMIIFGGQYSGNETNRVFQLSFKDNNWYQLLPGGISNIEPVNQNQDLRIRHNDASSSSQEHNTDSSKSPMPEPRENTIAVWYDDENYILVYGGWANNRCLNDMWLFNIHSHTWTEVKYQNLEKDIPDPRGGHAAVMINDRFLYIYGGFYNPNYLNDLWVFDMDRREWHETKFTKNHPDHIIPSGSWFHSLNLLTENDRDIPSIVLFGGEDCNNLMLGETLIIQPDDELRKYWYPQHSHRRLKIEMGGKIRQENMIHFSDLIVICQS